MPAVTCFQCGHTVEISPDAERCELCGTNLRRLISAEQASRYFYRRAADLSAKGDVGEAQNEVQRGLAYQPSSELHLLGAILCKRQARYDDMRHHIAAIPVDDVLRGEAEWMLRSHQARQRQSPDPRRAQEQAPPPDDELLPTLMDEVRPSPHKAPPRSRVPALVAFMAMMALLVLLGWYFWQEQPSWLAGLLPAPSVAAPAAQPILPAPEKAAATLVPVELVAPTTAVATATELPPTPTVAVAPDLAKQAAEPIAASSPEAVVQSKSYDLRTVLIEAQRPDLAENVTGRLEGGTLVIEGSVASEAARAELEELVLRLPGVDAASVVNVLVRPPATYTVQEGDSLWTISLELYGTPDRIEDLFAANRDILPSANALSVGMVLQVPPVE
ncbi:MAG: LysM peptidoglycan-binding domain-containing protein [Caldilinea sp.]|nr:LysM peptidoglycan-binding domain-containing protein [Caldilineaceae bacterium]MCB9124990.1 LysM peptidoglycan-binding domain-containing protein [Caldilineaceae bacterium]MCW5843971.1 LysM peptidoglycan-binding domain-containing protein [Caldilinea sp.]